MKNKNMISKRRHSLVAQHNAPTVLLTRSGSGGALAGMITRAGATPFCYPVVDIQPYMDPAWGQVTAQLVHVDRVILTSRHAVSGFHAQGGRLTPRLASHVLAVGSSTVDACANYGWVATSPALEMSTAGLLALPGLQADRVAGQQLLIIKGVGGRAQLAEQLTVRGARVRTLAVYQRQPQPMAIDQWLTRQQLRQVSVIVATSGASIQYLAAALEMAQLTELFARPLVLAHTRHQACAQASGFTGPLRVADNASAAAVFKALML